MASASRIASFPKGLGGRSSFSGHVVTVFGATGFIGRYVVNRLGKIGSQLVVPYRYEQANTRHLRVMGDLGQIVFTPYHIENEESIYNAVKHSNAVVNLAGRNYQKFLSRFSLRDVHVDGAARLARISKEAGVERFVHVSALGANSASSHEFRSAKGDGEKAVMAEFPSAAILRPANVLGLEDRFLNIFGRQSKLTVRPLPSGSMESLKSPVFVTDVAEAVIRCVDNPATQGKTYELVGPKEYRLGQLLDYIYRMVYRDFIPLNVPMPLALLAAAGNELNLKRPFMSRSEMLQVFSSDERTPEAEGLEELGITATPLEEYALAVLRRYRNQVYFSIPVDQTEKDASS